MSGPYYHIHTIDSPYCRDYYQSVWFPQEMEAQAAGVGGVLLSDMSVRTANCPYFLEMIKQQTTTLQESVQKLKEKQLTSTYRVALTPAQHTELGKLLEEDAKAVLCTECGEVLGKHAHPVAGGHGTTGVVHRKTGARKRPEDREQCPHCKGPLHFNDAGSKTNLECLQRQMCMYLGYIHDPQRDRLPVMTTKEFVLLAEWIIAQEGKGITLEYGKMSSSGGAATYSARRSKTVTPAVLVPEAMVPASPPSGGGIPPTEGTSAPEDFRLPGPPREALEDMAAEAEAAPLTPEEEAEAKLEATRQKDRERKAKRRELLKNSSR